IIGGGFGGIELAKRLRSKEVQVVMLDKHNYHTFQPLLYQVATGGLEPDSIAYPLRKIFKNQRNFTFRVAEVLSIDPVQKLVHTSIGHTSYDFLVLATGSETNFFGNKEMEHYAMPMKTVPEALDLRSLILQHFEAALLEDSINEQEAHMNFVVVGGGPTGVEICGALAELKNHVLPKDYPELDLRKMQINLLEGTQELLGAMSDNSSVKAAKFLKEMGVNLWLNARVLSYDGKTVQLDSGRLFESYNVIWTAGVRGKVIEGIDSSAVLRGNRYKVNEFSQVEGHESIFAIGDVAAMISDEYPHGHPGVAPAAMQQGKHLARNIIRLVNGAPMEPFDYFDKGSMATIV
ncbi:MAG TPA: FAD-dependent oxidoreductase, partial [Anseongella sp.]|nr:FAD-dependent oxidoreductase [Anseongella sp.]